MMCILGLWIKFLVTIKTLFLCNRDLLVVILFSKVFGSKHPFLKAREKGKMHEASERLPGGQARAEDHNFMASILSVIKVARSYAKDNT